MTPKFKHLFTALAIICLISIPVAAFAAQQVDKLPAYPGVGQGDAPKLSAEETIDGPVFYAGDTITVDGRVNGTLFTAGQSVDVNGHVDGDLFAAGEIVTIRGEVTGNIYAAGATVSFEGKTDKDIFAAGSTVSFDKNAASRDAFVGGATADLSGDISRRLFVGSESLRLLGSVGSDVYASTTSLQVRDGAKIQGNLYYESTKEADIGPEAEIAGDHQWAKMTSENPSPQVQSPSLITTLMAIAFAIASGLIIWAIITGMRPLIWHDITIPLAQTPLKTLAFGLLAGLTLPVLIILLLITIIGAPAAFAILLFAILLSLLAKVIASAGISLVLIERFNFPAIHGGVWSFLAVYTLLVLLSKLPYLGSIITLLAIFIAFGLVVMHAFVPPFRKDRPRKLNPAPEDLPPYSDNPIL